MRTIRVLVLAALAAGSLTVLAPAASASAPAVSKTCKSLNTLNKKLAKINPSDSKDLEFGALGDIGSAFHKAAKSAPPKLKSALNTIGDVYESMGDAGSVSGALAAYGKNGQKYTKAFQTFGTYLATNCSGVS
jgi:hypothetical protein